ncbi:MAG: DUF971 domain-containing protein [Planctomycetes bacterium]|nr:DUF971 domain-containing protein [Planctomycetota bacterium]
MVRSPEDVKAVTEQRSLEITWEEGHIGRYPYRTLRGECPCAGCVDELTGVRTLDIASIAEDITIGDMQLVGNYALRINWSDGHSTGLYSWKMLRALCPCPQCAGREPGSPG